MAIWTPMCSDFPSNHRVDTAGTTRVAVIYKVVITASAAWLIVESGVKAQIASKMELHLINTGDYEMSICGNPIFAY